VRERIVLRMSSMNRNSTLDIGLFNILGQKVRSYRLSGILPGQICLETGEIPSGLYILRIKGSSLRKTFKVMVLQ
jgi:hypothetical protein